MKKFITIIASFAFVACLLSGCQIEGYNDGYDEGYDDGYNDGYSDAEFEIGYLSEEFFDGYEAGYDDGYAEVYDAIEDASYYARAQTGWSVYEAWCNISIYQEGVHPYGYELPTEEEYLQSIETLVLFCEHLDNAGFGG